MAITGLIASEAGGTSAAGTIPAVTALAGNAVQFSVDVLSPTSRIRDELEFCSTVIWLLVAVKGPTVPGGSGRSSVRGVVGKGFGMGTLNLTAGAARVA